MKHIEKSNITKENAMKHITKSNTGQGLIEYLILVALMAIATIGVVRSINHVVNSKFLDVESALRGKGKTQSLDPFNTSLAKKRDFTNFLNGTRKGRGRGASQNEGASQDGNE